MVRLDDDYLRWTEQQAHALRTRQFDALDVDALAEEIEDMGKSERREVRSRLTVLAVHLLKQRVQPDLDGRSWRATIGTQRKHIEKRLRESPSLRTVLPELWAEAREDANDDAALETGIPADRFAFEVLTLDEALPPSAG